MKFIVKGICLVPMEAEATVEADTPVQALSLAQEQFKANAKALLISGSMDEDAAFDWVAEALPA